MEDGAAGRDYSTQDSLEKVEEEFSGLKLGKQEESTQPKKLWRRLRRSSDLRWEKLENWNSSTVSIRLNDTTCYASQYSA